MPDELKGYKILSRQGSAKAELYFAQRWGKEYVVKEYRDYRFSEQRRGEELPAVLRAANERTQEYFMHLRKTERLMRRSMRRDGLTNIPLDVFRHENRIYKVTKRLEPCGMTAEELNAKLSFEQMTVLLRTLLTQLEKLEEIGFIHCDIKPENIIVCRKKDDVYSASVIDYDSGIIIRDDDSHYVDYTPECAAPEMMEYKDNEDSEKGRQMRRQLTCRADIFSAACVMVNYLTGEIWLSGGRTPGEVLTENRVLTVPGMHPIWRTMIRGMLRFEPERRLSAAQVLEGVNLAQAEGLTEELSEPFDGCPKGEIVECGMRQVLLGEEGASKRSAWWHEEQLWTPVLVRRNSVWAERDRQVRRRREEMTRLCERISALSSPQEALFPIRTQAVGRRFFAVQEIPEGRMMRLKDMDGVLPMQEADRIMRMILAGADKLHRNGILCCLTDIDDIWLFEDADGRLQPMLGGLHRAVCRDSLPSAEEVDEEPLIAAPEVCLYLGANDPQMRSECADMIDERSDLFTLGLVYHMLLSGVLPYMTDENELYLGEAATMPETDTPNILIDGKMDERHRKLIGEMLGVEPEDRPESCEAVSRRIERFYEVPKQADAEVPQQRKAEAQEQSAGWTELKDDGEQVWSRVFLFDEFEPIEYEPAESRKAKMPEVIFEEMPEEEAKGGNAPKAYVLCGEESFGGWSEAEGVSGEGRAQAHCTGRVFDKKYSERFKRIARKTRQIGRKCGAVLPCEGIYPADGTLAYSVVSGEEGSCRDMTDAQARREFGSIRADAALKRLLRGVQALHDGGLLCGVLAAENAVMTGDELRINAAEYGLMKNDAKDAQLWREWMKPLRPAAHKRRELTAAGAYLSPEAQRMLDGEDVTLTEASDMFSLGVLYHVLWSGRLPEGGSETGGWNEALAEQEASCDLHIPFAQRRLMEKMLSRDAAQRPQSCGEVLSELDNLYLKRDKTHSVTVKHDGEPLVAKTAWLYAVIDGKESFVAGVQTDHRGKAVFVGYLPEGKYYVRCEGEKTVCRWRNF